MFSWCDLYALSNDPAWATWSKRSRNRAKRELLARAQRELLEYEKRHGLATGSLRGGEGAGAAPCARPAAEEAPPPPQGAPPALAAGPPPPPPTQPPPDVAAKRLFDEDGNVAELPSAVFGEVALRAAAAGAPWAPGVNTMRVPPPPPEAPEAPPPPPGPPPQAAASSSGSGHFVSHRGPGAESAGRPEEESSRNLLAPKTSVLPVRD